MLLLLSHRQIYSSFYKPFQFSRFYTIASKQKWLKRQKNDHFTKEAKLQNLRSRAAFKLKEIDDKYNLFRPDKIQNVLDLGFAPGSWSEVARQRCHARSMILGVDILPCQPPEGVSSLQANILSKKTQDLIRLYFNKHNRLDHILNNNNNDDVDVDVDNIYKDHGSQKPNVPGNIVDPEFEHELKDEEEYREVFSPDVGISSHDNRQPIDVILSDMYVPFPRLTGFTNNLTNLPYIRLMNTSGVAIRDHLLSIDLCDAALVTAIDLLKVNGSFVCKLYTGKEDKLFENRLKHVFKSVQRFKPVSSRLESKEIYFVALKKRSDVDKLKVFN